MRTSETITQDEIKAYREFCARHRVIDNQTEDGIANANFIADYFLNIWKEMMTEKNFETCFPLIQSHLKFYAPHQQEFEKLYASLSAEEQIDFKEWKGVRGLKDTYRSAVALLSWIKAHGFKVTKDNLQLAVGQNRVQPFLEWYDSVMPKAAPDPRQHKDDGTGFLGDRPVNEPRWKRVQREREEREKRDGINRSEASSHSIMISEAKRKAEELRGATHSESDQLLRIFVTSGTEIDWAATLQARLQMQKQFNKHREVSRFIR
jgi:hypothetical protein